MNVIFSILIVFGSVVFASYVVAEIVFFFGRKFK